MSGRALPSESSQTQTSAPGGRVSSVARWLPLFVGTLALIGLVIMEVLRGVDRVEIIATALFVLVAGASMVSMRVGIAAALIATVTYALLRRNALDVAGGDSLNRMIFGRAIGYLAFGLLLGSLTRTLRPLLRPTTLESEPKATRIDGLAALDREIAMAKRHNRSLTAVTIDLTDAAGERELAQAIRSSDILIRGTEDNESALTILLPETDIEGAKELVLRLPSSESPRVISLLSEDDAALLATDEIDVLRRRVSNSGQRR